MAEFLTLSSIKKGSSVAVAMSGGLDSSVSALLLKERGCNVFGVTMKLYKEETPLLEDSRGCGACFSPIHKKDIEDAKKFCLAYGIPHYVADLSIEYESLVLNEVKRQYRAGITPNPCVICNKCIKFGALFKWLSNKRLPFDYYVTGHYANLIGKSSPSGLYRYNISQAADLKKDQSYFLYRLESKTLKQVRFILGGRKKEEVRQFAIERGLSVAKKRESQDFASKKYFDFLFHSLVRPGNILDLSGNIIGQHEGITNYTIGKRRGINTKINIPLYVYKIEAATNSIVVAPKDFLFSSALLASQFIWQIESPTFPYKVQVKIRAASPLVSAIVTKEGITREEGREEECFKISFLQPVLAVTPGQSVVLYDNKVVVGGGIIKESIS